MTTFNAEAGMLTQIEHALSDLKIYCGGKAFPVHELILHAQSEYFRKLFSGPLKTQESCAVTLELPDDDPYALRVLLRYCYRNVLDTTSLCLSTHQHQDPAGSAFLNQIYALADKYDVSNLRSLVVQRLAEICDPITDLADFIDALCVVESLTAENTIWDMLLPKTKASLQTLLKHRRFRELLTEESDFSPRLLRFIAASPDTKPSG